jgi:hypothetical protein
MGVLAPYFSGYSWQKEGKNSRNAVIDPENNARPVARVAECLRGVVVNGATVNMLCDGRCREHPQSKKGRTMKKIAPNQAAAWPWALP